MKKEDITLPNIKNFFEGNYNLLKYNLSQNIEDHIKEQALYRAMLCSSCLEAGKCKICNCSTPGLFFAPKKEDSEGRWSKMMSEEEWNAYKQSMDLKIPNDFLEIKEEPYRFIKRKDFTNFDLMDKNFLSKVDNCILKLPDHFHQKVKILKTDNDTIDINSKVQTLFTLGRGIKMSVASKNTLAALTKILLEQGLSIGIGTEFVKVDNRKPQEIYLLHA